MSRRYPKSPIVGVGAVVWKGDKVLLIKRGKPPAEGAWSLPGGGQELGETVKEAVVREVMEETGLEVEVTGLIDVVDAITPDADQEIEHHYTLVDFRCEWRGGEPVAGSDAAAVRWASISECETLVAWLQTLRIIKMSKLETTK